MYREAAHIVDPVILNAAVNMLCVWELGGFHTEQLINVFTSAKLARSVYEDPTTANKIYLWILIK